MDSISESISRAMHSSRPSMPQVEAPPQARHCMTSSLIAFNANQELREVVQLLLAKRISGGPVLDEKRRLVGMISEMDCLRALASGAYDGEPFERGRLVRDVMTKNCITVDPQTGIFAMVHLFEHHHIKRLPVVEDGVVVGQVSRRDILRTIEERY